MISKYLEKYKVLEPNTTDRRYFMAVATPKDSKYSSYNDVIYEFVKNKNIKEIKYDKLNNTLTINNLCYRHVPLEFFDHPNVTKKGDNIIINT